MAMAPVIWAINRNFRLRLIHAYREVQESFSRVTAAVAESGAKAPSDMGKVIALVKPRVAGRADMGEVSKLVKAKLAGA